MGSTLQRVLQSYALPLSSSPTSSNSFIGYQLTGGYVLNCLLSPLKLCTQVSWSISPIYCTSINPLGLCILPTLNY